MRRLPTIVIGMVALSGCGSIDTTVRGPQPARWAFAPGQEISAETTEFVALVTEVECASGQSGAGRVVGPELEVTDDSIVVEFRVRPLGGVQSCPGNPPTPVVVRLDQPLGERQLLDGGSDPPREPPVCTNVVSCD
jgi:hypothetical protein